MFTLAGVWICEQGDRTLFGRDSGTAVAQDTSLRRGVAAGPDVIAVRLHANWCKPSHTMAPLCHELKQSFSDDRVLFIDLDLTNEATQMQANYLVSALGIADRWIDLGAHSGELVLVDTGRKEVTSRLTQEQNLQQMTAALLTSLNPGSGSGPSTGG